ncbi:heavy metal translocating P-type ATPase [Cohnella sp. GCM10027633]|uniref:heavy metal translocating P-type ATPase n=1 Tax=unclassified Cohnella TaxID=2636738 RepID=UPI00362BB507
MSEIHLRITGMTCSACSSRIEKTLLRLDAVRDAAVSLATSSAIVILRERDADIAPVIGKIRSLGYDAAAKTQGDENPFAAEARGWRDRFIVSAALSSPLLFAMLAHLIGPLGEAAPSFVFHPIYQAIVGTMLCFYCGYPFLVGAIRSIRHPNMDALVALGMMSAYVYSLYQLIAAPQLHGSMHHSMRLHFDAIAMVVTTITLGKWLESIAKGNAFRSLTALNDLHSNTARVIRQGRLSEPIPISLVRPGDRVTVQGGDRIPIDGSVEEGAGEVDESLLTGESTVLARRPGDRVYAGTRLSAGSMTIRALSGGLDTRLARMIAMVEQAQAKKPKIQRQADRVVAWFVPIMILLAVSTFAWWYAASSAATAIGHAMAVLLVACPCALGLATPISVLIGSSHAARRGIAFKEGSALETMSRVDVFIFDKTGTLTKGKPSLTEIRSQRLPAMQLLRLVASLERNVEHPLALAVVREANAKRLLLSSATDTREAPGEGVSGIVDRHVIVVGTMDWLNKNGVSGTAGYESSGANADSVLHVAIDGKREGLLSFRDTVREDAVPTIGELSRFARIVMSTGDREDAAKRIAEEVGIAHVQSRMLPERKMDAVLAYQGEGNIVAMVGDGANDAAAMAASNVGIVMAGGNDAALQAGDVVLVGGRLSAIGDACEIARRTLRNIKQNLILACVYNVVMIPLAIAGQLDPRASCIAMAGSSLLVVANALRLRGLKLPRQEESGRG